MTLVMDDARYQRSRLFMEMTRARHGAPLPSSLFPQP
jgi:hypothetical protein